MSYMQEMDAWLEKTLAAVPTRDRQETKRLIKAKLLESYRNGQKAGEKPRATWENLKEVLMGAGFAPEDAEAYIESLKHG
jgi:hypothetical protein